MSRPRRALLGRISLPLLAELGALALIVGVAAAVYLRSIHSALTFDEGDYLASLDALRHGQALGRDVFLDQPPGWYLLLQAIAGVVGQGYVHVRVALMLIALLGLVLAWAVGRAFGGPVVGVAAAAILAVAPPYATYAATVEAEPASTVLALASIACIVYGGRRRWPALATGVVLALAVSVKLFAVVAALSIAAIIWQRRRLDQALLVVAGFVTVLVALVVGYRGVLRQIWQGVFQAHLNAVGGAGSGTASNVARIVRLFDPRTAFGLIALAGIALALRRLALRQSFGLWPLWLFTLGAALFTVSMHPLWEHHLVLLAAALAVPVSASVVLTLQPLPRWSFVVLAVLLAAGAYQEHRRLARDALPEPAGNVWASRYIAAHTAPGDLVVSDVPSIPYFAGRHQPGQLIDTSIPRIVDAYLKPRDVLRDIDASHAALVLVGRNFTYQPQIVRGIAARYPKVVRHGSLTIYMP